MLSGAIGSQSASVPLVMFRPVYKALVITPYSSYRIKSGTSALPFGVPERSMPPFSSSYSGGTYVPARVTVANLLGVT